MPRPLLAAAALTIVSTLGLTACAGGGASDVAGAPGASGGAPAKTTTVNLFAYAVPKVAFDKLIPAFQQTAAGKGVEFQQSYGASGDQSPQGRGRRRRPTSSTSPSSPTSPASSTPAWSTRTGMRTRTRESRSARS